MMFHDPKVDDSAIVWRNKWRPNHSISGHKIWWNVTAKSRSGITLWIGRIYDEMDTWRFWNRLITRSLTFRDYVIPVPAMFPSLLEIPVTFELATITTFNSSGSLILLTSSQVTYLVVGAGASGGTPARTRKRYDGQRGLERRPGRMGG